MEKEKKYLIDNPTLMAEWNWEKNNELGLAPTNLTLGSNKKVWWKCSKGHEWKEIVANRTRRNSNCPYCSNHRVLLGYNDLQTTHPDIAKQWNYNKNEGILPTQVTAGSNKNVWWICEKGHEWKASVNNRAGNNLGCSHCSKERRVSFPEKAIFFYLQKLFPDIEEQKHFSWLKRKELDIFIPSLNLAIEYDGEFWHKKQIRDIEKEELCIKHGVSLIRIREPKCPKYVGTCICIETGNPNKENYLEKPLIELINHINYTYGLKLFLDYNIDRDSTKIYELLVTYEKERSLKSLFPEIAKQWNYDKNDELKPEFFSAMSNAIVWWKCVHGHEWRSAISDRTIGKRGCPYCSNKRVLSGYNDLTTIFPEIAKEWNYDKNNISPDQIVFGSSRKVWWKCAHGHEWQATIVSRTKTGNSCPVCSNHKVITGVNDFASQYPDLLKEWDWEKNTIILPSQISYHYDKKVWWKCPMGHSYESKVYDRVEKGTNCPYCSRNKVMSGFNDLETLFPEIAKTWNYIKNGNILPSQVASQSNKKYWWICSKGHEWESSVHNRVKGRGCPFCAGQKVLKGYNDLTTLNPKIAEEWNYEKNGNLKPENFTAKSGKKVWWKCSDGHEWQARIIDRNNGNGCPICYREKRKKKEQ